jgi:aminoglycoside/choline kinase family phosphotransferase
LDRCLNPTRFPDLKPQDLLIRQTRERFAASPEDAVSIQPIEKGGSDRSFYRVRMGSRSLILVKYSSQREENTHYVRIAEVLDALGVRTPKIYFHDPEQGLIWMEDLGERDLWSYRERTWPVRRAYYELALDEVWRLHERGWKGLAKFPFTLQIEFNAALYRWEQKYFFDHCLGRYFENLIAPEKVERIASLPIWNAIAERLSAHPRVLVHRDFQSQNIIIHGEHAHLIDFQGLRPGLAHYDLASLLYDPYAQLAASERDELLDYYLSLGSRVDLGPTRADFDEIYRLCALQRLMQALGAYGFLGLVRERPSFLAYVPIALPSLREVAAKVEGLEEFNALLAGLPT